MDKNWVIIMFTFFSWHETSGTTMLSEPEIQQLVCKLHSRKLYAFLTGPFKNIGHPLRKIGFDDEIMQRHFYCVPWIFLGRFDIAWSRLQENVNQFEFLVGEHWFNSTGKLISLTRGEHNFHYLQPHLINILKSL